MRKKIKIGDKVYAIDMTTKNLITETIKSIYKTETDGILIHTEKYCFRYNKEKNIYIPDNFDSDFHLFFATRKEAIKYAKNEVKDWIKSWKGDLLEFKEFLKKLTKMEKENDI